MGDKVGHKLVLPELNPTQTQVLATIRNNPSITREQLTKAVRLGKTTIDKCLAVLKKLNYIERVGSNKTGYWKVLK